MHELRDYAIGVIGAGSWGTALANLLAEKGYTVTQWVYERELIDILNSGRCNTWYLPGIELDSNLSFTGELAEALSDKELVLWATPVKVFRQLFSRGRKFPAPTTRHVSASKGIETGSLRTLSQIAAKELCDPGLQRFVVLSGPTFAAEVSRKLPSALVVASRDPESAALVQRVVATSYLRTYTSNDILGVELGGALKNVIAIAAGIAEGLGFGQNTRAALITRGLAEIIRLGSVLKADPGTFAGLSGVGDLVLTCTSTQSRNYTVGMEIGKGRKPSEVLEGMQMVAEGVDTTRSAFELAVQHGVAMPIVQEIFQVLFKAKPPAQAVEDLMSRDLKHERA